MKLVFQSVTSLFSAFLGPGGVFITWGQKRKANEGDTLTPFAVNSQREQKGGPRAGVGAAIS